LERRRQPANRSAARSLARNTGENSPAAASLSLPNITELILDGQITIGQIGPVGCVAVASDGHNTLAMLVRRRGESLAALLTRLDMAIDQALNEDVYTDEVNSPPNYR
jgi:hypothetical protein